MRYFLQFLLLATAIFEVQNCIAQVKRSPIVRTEAGLVSGSFAADGKTLSYKGLPFAAPPVNELRWKGPQPVKPWSGVRACTKFAPSAIQTKPEPFFVWSEEFLTPKEPISEDCLYLNIWAPANYESQKLPVIVWIHGGGFQSGSGACPIYDGEGLAKKGVIFVTINYRLGVFGFLAHPELSKESGHGSGNYAFLDQIEALKWVQKNIAAFGGDPSRVTIAGQSAGAFSVSALVASPLCKGLFAGAIAQSGGFFHTDRLTSLTDAEQAGIAFVNKAGAADLAALRKLPADYLLQQSATQNIQISIDGHVLPKEVSTIFAEGNQNDVPLLAGWNAGDGFLFGQPLTALQWEQSIKDKFGKFSKRMLEQFPAGTQDSVALLSQIRFNRDLIFAWQSHLWARAQTKSGKAGVWLYQFDRTPPGRPDLDKYGAFHSAEIAYALNTLPMWKRPWTQLDRRISDEMSAYWVRFATFGNPSPDTLNPWPTWSPERQVVMNFGEHIGPKGGLLRGEFAVLNDWLEAGAPDYSQFKKEVFIHEGDTLPYRVLLPKDYDPSKKYPLMLFLHGAGERGNDNETQLVHGASLFLKASNRKQFPCIVLFPQCPKAGYWGSVQVDRSKTPLEFKFDYSAYPATPALKAAVALVRRYVSEGSVDTGRIYISGLSMGGFGTFEAVYREPGLFAAAAPICGGGDVANYSADAAKVPFRISHGDVDNVVPVQFSRDMLARLQALGGNAEYKEYPGVSHNSWENAFAEGDYLQWFFSKSK